MPLADQRVNHPDLALFAREDTEKRKPLMDDKNLI